MAAVAAPSPPRIKEHRAERLKCDEYDNRGRQKQAHPHPLFTGVHLLGQGALFKIFVYDVTKTRTEGCSRRAT
jgi:hypothetical protein